MPNIIELNLLSNKSIVATMQGYPLANENSYKIVAGDENATQFTIKSKPTDYENATYFVEMVNAKGYKVKTTQNSEEREEIKSDSFTLPVGMAVEGYGYISISCECDITSTTIKGAVITTDYTKISERGKAYVFTYEKGWQLKVEDTIYKNVSLSTYGIAITNDVEINLKEGDKIIVTTRAKPVFQPLKIKVWNTLPNWKDEISEGGGSGGGVDQELIDQVNANTENIATLTTEKVSKTDYATGDVAGIVRVRGDRGIRINTVGVAQALIELEPASDTDLANRVWYKPITSGILDKAIVVGISTNAITLTEEEKTSALEWLGAVKKVTQANMAYGTTTNYPVSFNPMGYAIPRYSTNNNLKTSTPVDDNDCTPKKYVDDSIAGVNQQNAKMYLHKIVSIQTTESPWGEIRFNLITSNPTPYTKESIINEKVSKMLDGTSFNAYVDLSGSANNYVRKSGVFYYDESRGNHGYMPGTGIFVGMLFGDGSTATLMLDDHHETLTDEVIEL